MLYIYIAVQIFFFCKSKFYIHVKYPGIPLIKKGNVDYIDGYLLLSLWLSTRDDVRGLGELWVARKDRK